MRCAIMQPTYIPWAGYFNLIASVDKFVFLDDVQYERRSWQSWNRILLNGSNHYLTVPVIKAPLEELLLNINIDNSQDWRAQHLSILNQAYRKTPYGSEVLSLIENIFDQNHLYLARLNEALILRFSEYMELSTLIDRASLLSCGGRRSEHVAEICHSIGCKEYFSPAGSREYMTKECFTEVSGIPVRFQNFIPKEYSQLGASQFISHLSIVDVLAHHGVNFAKAYIGQGTQL